MKNIIAKVLAEQTVNELPVVSLEEEIHHITTAELCRTEVVSEMGDSSRTLELINALESLALVADTIKQPTPQEAALIQIAGDSALAGTGLSGEEITPSMEDAESGTTVSAKVRSAIEQIIRALKDLLKRIAHVVGKYIQHARAAAGGMVQRQKVIQERLTEGAHHGWLNTEEEFTMSMPVADGHTLTSLSEVVDEALKFSVAVDWFVNKAAAFNIDYSSGFVDLYAKLGEGDKGITVIEQFAILNKIADLTGHIANSIPHAHVKADTDHDYYSVKTQQTVQLLGGISIAVTSAKPIEHNTGLSSASIKHAVTELMEVGFKVHTEPGGFYKEAFQTKPLNQAELHKAFDLCKILIEHFTTKSDHTALAAATSRRSEFAETAVDHLTRYTEKFKKNDIAAKEYGSSALRIGQSILTNATVPYTQMTTAVSRVINLLQSAILKSLNAHEGNHEESYSNRLKEMAERPGNPSAKKAEPSNEGVTDLVVSADGTPALEGLFDWITNRKKKDPKSTESKSESLWQWVDNNLSGDRLKAGLNTTGRSIKLGSRMSSVAFLDGHKVTTAEELMPAVTSSAKCYMDIFRKYEPKVAAVSKTLHVLKYEGDELLHSEGHVNLTYENLRALILKFKGKLPASFARAFSPPTISLLGNFKEGFLEHHDEVGAGFPFEVKLNPTSATAFAGVSPTELDTLVKLGVEVTKKIRDMEVFVHSGDIELGIDQSDPPWRGFVDELSDDMSTLTVLNDYSHEHFELMYTNIIDLTLERMFDLSELIWTIVRGTVTLHEGSQDHKPAGM